MLQRQLITSAIVVAMLLWGGRETLAGCTITWDGGAGTTSWHTAANWDTNVLPGAADDVCIPLGSSVVFSTGTVTVASLQCAGSLNVSAGTLNLAGASTVDGSLTVGGIVGGAGTIAVNGAVTLAAGELLAGGAVSVSAGGSFTLNTSTNVIRRTIDNSGTMNWTAGQIILGNNAVLNNLAGGVFNCSANANVGVSFSVAAINNFGTFNNAAGATSFLSGTLTFNNQGGGVLNVDGGSITFGAGSDSGLIDVDAGATLVFLGSNIFTHNASSLLTGAGTIQFGSSTTSGVTNTFPAGTFDPLGTVNFASGTITVNSAINPAVIVNPMSATLNINANQVFPAMVITGNLGGSGSFTFPDGVTLSAGEFDVGGPVTIPVGATLTLNTTTNWIRRTVNNSGTVNWAAAPIAFGNGAVLNNLSGGVFNASANANASGGGSAINNFGTFNNTAGATDFNASNFSFHNQSGGVVNVDGGSLTLAAGSNSGLIDVDAGTTVNCFGFSNNFTYNAGSLLTGAGTMVFGAFTGGTHTFPAGTFDPLGTVNFSGGTITVNSVINPAVIVNPMSATLNINADQTLPAMVITGNLGGSGSFTFPDGVTLSAGEFDVGGPVTIPVGATLTLNTTTNWIRRTVNNSGTVNWAGAPIALGNGAMLNNLSGGVFNASANANAAGAFSAINNFGTFNNTAGATDFNASNFSFHNQSGGVVNVDGGSLTLAAGSNSGLIDVDAGTTVNCFGFSNNFTYNAGSLLTGAGTILFGNIGGTHTFPAGTFDPLGTVNFAGGTITVNSAINPAVIVNPMDAILNSNAHQIWPATVVTGTLGGSGNLTFPVSLAISGGVVQGSGAIIIPAGSTLTFNQLTNVVARTINNSGTINWTSAQINWNNATINNLASGVFNSSAAANVSATGVSALNNAGTFNKTANASSTSGVSINNSGAVNILGGSLTVPGSYTQTAGSTILNGGSMTKSGGTIALQGGVLGGVGTLTGAVSATGGTVAPGTSPGIFNISGSITRSAASTLDVELGGLAAGTQHDRLVVSGSAALAGTLRLAFVNGFELHAGDTFTILTASPVTGTFSAVDVVGHPDCVATVQYTPTSVIVQVETTPPVVVCQDIVANLDAAGQVNVSAEQIDNGSTDNCEIATIELSRVSFTCSDIGPNPVTLTVTDVAGNQTTCDAVVTVADNTPPIAICQAITVSVDAKGAAAITPAQVFASGSDNCGTVNLVSVVPNTFSCANLGGNIVTLTVNDGHGNEATCQTVVTVQDTTPPVVSCQSISVSLDEKGNVTIAPGQVFGSGSDNCGTVNPESVTPNSLTCANLGPNVVTLTVNDGHGNQATCQATVTVQDTTPPVIACQDIALFLNSGGLGSITPEQVLASGTDNCGTVNLLSVAPDSFTCSNLGDNLVTLTVDDGHGNQSTCQAIVSVIATGHYQGKAGGSWFEPSNWCFGIAPISDTEVSLNELVLIDQPGALANLIDIQSGGELVVGSASGSADLDVVHTITVENGGALTISANGTVSAAEVVVEPGATLNLNSSLSTLIVNNLTVLPGGTVNWSGGAVHINGGVWTNPAGTTISVGCAGQTASLVVSGGGAVQAALIDVCALGSAGGEGSFIANLNNGGLVSPGSPGGALLVDGNYVQAADAELHIEIGGLTPGIEHDVLTITGSALLDGDLAISIVSGFVPTVGDSFAILQGTNVSGAFATINGSPETCGKIFGLTYGVDAVMLETVYDGALADCNNNTVPDMCDLKFGTSADCNGNDVPDECDIANATSLDCNGNDVPDECDLALGGDGGGSFDCNVNAIPDECDLDSGYSVDLNGNDVPDDCEEFEPGDINGDGTVNVLDLLLVISGWGECQANLACPANIAPPPNGDTAVDVLDLLYVVSNWG